jgi:hypothetical protein
MRSTSYSQRIVVSAEDSHDLNKRKLRYHWVVLRGDPRKVTIKEHDGGQRAEITVDYQERQPIEPGSKMESSRVDIGVFAYNDKYYSAPAFVTFFSLDNQRRTYDEKKRIKIVDYADPVVSKNYSDPAVDFKKRWRDEYSYDEQGRLIGWTRHRDNKAEAFTADGALILEKDAKGRALKARTVRYLPRQLERNQAPVLEQQPGDTVLRYEYASDDDRVGRVVKREKAE